MLIGYPSGWTRDRIERLAREHGVAESCAIYESIPQSQVAELVADSRAYILLSRREGANRALYEALFCDTPVIVPRDHRGVNTDQVVPEVGVLFRDGELPEAILSVVDGPRAFQPRHWALRNTGFENAARALNTVLREGALQRGWPWTKDIVPKKNVPNLRYAHPGRYAAFEPEYRSLGGFLLPPEPAEA